MAVWTRICSLDECPEGEAREFVAGETIVAVFQAGGRFFALDGVCPHQGGPLGKGSLCGHTVTCPWHGWQFDIRSGQHLTNRSLVHPGFEVRIENGAVWITFGARESGH